MNKEISNTNDKKKVVIQLVIFMLLATLPLSVVVLIANHMVGGLLFASGDHVEVITLVSALGMMFPSLAHFLTRVITKEGWKDNYLMPRLKGNMKYYFAAVWVIMAASVLFFLIICKVYAPQVPLMKTFYVDKYGMKFADMLFTLGIAVFIFFPYFGEEWGWRGYMMPKLMQIMNKPMAVLVGGILWALWHAPLTLSGHNLGVDYPGYPWKGIVMMCISCTGLNAFLTWLTEKSKSIYPATICHGVFNSIGLLHFVTMMASKELVEAIDDLTQYEAFKCLNVVCVIMGVIFVFLLCQKKKEL